MIIDFVKANLSLSSPLMLFVLLSIGVVLLYARPAGRPARRFFLTLLIVFWLVTTAMGARVLTMGLSYGLSQIHSRGEANGADVVVLLGGGAATWNAAGRVAGVLTPSSILRVLETARVSDVIGARLVIASGGVPRPDIQLKPESDLLRAALISAGVPPEQIVEESRSKTTREQAKLIPAVLRAHGVGRFVLVTSPTHMRRALALFRAEGLDPVPSVSLIRSENSSPVPLALPSDEALRQSNEAVYQYAAWAYYWWQRFVPPRSVG